MSNMSYCRFSNTLEDLKDCQEHMDDPNISTAEKKARRALIKLCRDISGDFEDELDD